MKVLFFLVLVFWGGLAFAQGQNPTNRPGGNGQRIAFSELALPQQFELVERSILQDQFDLASRLLSEIDVPDNSDAAYRAQLMQARILARRGDLPAAIALLRNVVSEEPEFLQARLELAAMLRAMGQNDAARFHLRQISETTDNPEDRAKVEELISQIDASNRLRFSSFFSLVPSTNFSNGTETDTIYVFGLPFEVDETSQAQSGIGLIYGGTAAYELPINGGEYGTGFAAISFVNRDYRGIEFDQINPSFRFGWSRFRGGRGYRVQYQVDRRLVGNVPFDHGSNLQFTFTEPLAPRLSLRSTVSSNNRVQFGEPNSELRTNALSFDLTQRFRPGRSLTYSLSRSGAHNPERVHQTYDGAQIGLLGRYTLRGGEQLSVGLKIGRRNYYGQIPLSTVAQKDQYAELRIGALLPRYAVFGAAPNISLIRHVQNSNYIFSHKQSTGLELTFSRSF